MKSYELLNETIKFSTQQLEKFTTTNQLDTISNMVVTALYRKVIELSEGVSVAGINGLSGPASLSFRGLVEAYLAFSYILDDKALLDNRAKAYKIGYHKQQIEIAEQSLERTIDREERKQYEAGILQHKAELLNDELQEVLAEYNDVHHKGRNKFLPKWHALNKDATSINKLAKYVAEEIDGDQDILALVYSSLSVKAHNYLALNSIANLDGLLTIKPVRAIFNEDEDNYNFTEARALLTRVVMKYTEQIYPEYEGELKKFATYISPYLPE